MKQLEAPVAVIVCVCERETERQRDRERRREGEKERENSSNQELNFIKKRYIPPNKWLRTKKYYRILPGIKIWRFFSC